MWDDFTDYELIVLATVYGMRKELVVLPTGELANRTEIETRLTEVEHDAAFE